MVTMVDEMFDRAYRDSRVQMNASFVALFADVGRTLGDSLRALHRIEWSAPWDRAGRTR